MAIIGTPTNGDDVIIGDEANNRIDALPGNDRVEGRGGNDTLLGHIGDDTLLGEEGNDTLVGDIFGGTGNDRLSGGAGDDVLNGGLGANTLVGGPGDDLYALNSTDDVIIEQANAGIDRVNSGFSFTLGATLENLALTGTANLNGTGNAASNAIVGNSGNNVLHGLAGNDTFTGLDGNDTVTGGPGNDIFVGGNGNDILSGEAGNDVFAGQAGNDTLTGGSGNDLLAGFGGDEGEIDELFGGIGADVFVLGDKSIDFYDGTSFAIINDFNRSESDRMRVHGQASDYSLDKRFNLFGGAALDTMIDDKNGNTVAIVIDNTNVFANLDFVTA